MLKETDLSGMNASSAAQMKVAIFAQAINQATGRWGCSRNTVASVWFWFTSKWKDKTVPKRFKAFINLTHSLQS